MRAVTDAMNQDVSAYYASEKATALNFVAIGALSSVAGVTLVTRTSEFSRGFGWSVLSIGAFEAIGAGFYAFQVDSQNAHYASTLARDPAAYKREESVHIHGTTSRFVAYRFAELALAVAGGCVAVTGFAFGRDAWKGAGAGIAAEAITFYTLDSYGQSRALTYEERVRRFQPTVGVGGGDRAWTFGFRGDL
jgi:hypothetical protein